MHGAFGRLWNDMSQILNANYWLKTVKIEIVTITKLKLLPKFHGRMTFFKSPSYNLNIIRYIGLSTEFF